MSEEETLVNETCQIVTENVERDWFSPVESYRGVSSIRGGGLLKEREVVIERGMWPFLAAFACLKKLLERGPSASIYVRSFNGIFVVQDGCVSVIIGRYRECLIFEQSDTRFEAYSLCYP